MGSYSRICVVLSFILSACFCLCACNQVSQAKNTGQVVASDVEYSIRQSHKNSYVLDVKGKIRNTGDVDVKKVVVTGYCKSCVLEFTSQHWFTSDCDKMPNQKDLISYLVVGAQEDFQFEEVALYLTHESVPPDDLPENIEIVIESFETVE